MFSLSAPGLSRIRGEAKSMSCRRKPHGRMERPQPPSWPADPRRTACGPFPLVWPNYWVNLARA